MVVVLVLSDFIEALRHIGVKMELALELVSRFVPPICCAEFLNSDYSRIRQFEFDEFTNLPVSQIRNIFHD